MYWFCCSKCGQIYGLTSGANGTEYCPKCDSYFNKYGITSNASTAAIENYIPIQLPNAANTNKGSYTSESKGSKFLQPQEWNKLTINAKSIIINDDKISITINKDNIDKFNVIEINGVSFVKEDN